MALINCPECDHQVSDSAELCPNCGFNINDYNKKLLKRKAIDEVAETINDPVYPLLSIESIVFFLLLIIHIFLFVLLYVFDNHFSLKMVCFFAFLPLEIILIMRIYRKFKLYWLWQEDEKRYRIRKAKQLIIEWNKPNYGGHYILSFFIPIYGIIMGIRGAKRTDEYAYQDQNCLGIAIASAILYTIVLL